MIDGISGGLPGESLHLAAPPRPKDDPKHVLDSARQFEALLLAQLLKSVREAQADGWLGTGEDQSGESAMALAEEHFAQSLASSGGLGLAGLIADGLKKD